MCANHRKTSISNEKTRRNQKVKFLNTGHLMTLNCKIYAMEGYLRPKKLMLGNT